MSTRIAWASALIVLLLSGVAMALLGAGDSSSQSPVAVPAGAESARADATRLSAHRSARTAEELLLALMENQELTVEEAIERCSGDARGFLAEL